MIDRTRVLKNENIIWMIYVLFAILGIKANNLELEDIKNNSSKNKRKYKRINIFIFSIVIIIYIYFIYVTTTNLKQKKTKMAFLVFIGSILILISGILFLIAELNDEDVIIPNE